MRDRIASINGGAFYFPSDSTHENIRAGAFWGVRCDNNFYIFSMVEQKVDGF